eukprot:gnl/MRDRNA2_/MRDRNA2_18394_c0_seq1.p1 gnl/MRDRNA2_/MRDRNA2_18394_c0~~gnl/MRDRNA2_/MRDRNA2_18394_c0_seq1.p1  ORF type:complete len:560 (-),score=105.84 gnl/MRDRNA2_/MRDRNA2_18394_c0_seq1:400-2079(-)
MDLPRIDWVNSPYTFKNTFLDVKHNYVYENSCEERRESSCPPSVTSSMDQQAPSTGESRSMRRWLSLGESKKKYKQEAEAWLQTLRPETLSAAAKLKEAVSKLEPMEDAALYSLHIEQLLVAIEDAEASGVVNSRVDSAWDQYLRAHERKAALDDVLTEMQGEDFTALQNALKKAQDLSVPGYLLQPAKKKGTAMAELYAAMKGESPDLLASAFEAAKMAGLSSVLLERVSRMMSKKQAETILAAAMKGTDVKRIIRATASAAEAGVPSAVIDIARKRIALLRNGLQMPIVQMEAALLVGQTKNHMQMAELLGKVLVEHDVVGALPQLLQRIEMHGTVCDPEHSRVFKEGKQASFGLRGGRPYHRPEGWLRYSIQVNDFNHCKDWCVAYHGTRSDKIVPILLQGLRKPGEEGVVITHGQAWSQSNSTIYLSPSIEYAGHPVYAELFEVEDGRWAQLVFQCRVRPDAFVVRPGSLQNKHWPHNVRFDPNFDSISGLEWLVENPENIMVYGLMVREFGPKADAEVYGKTVCRVHRGPNGPEYEWTRLRAQEYRSRGLWMKP